MTSFNECKKYMNVESFDEILANLIIIQTLTYHFLN